MFPTQIKELLNLPDHVFPVVLVSMGYPKTIPKRRVKMHRDMMIFKDSYRELSDEEIKKAFDDKYSGLTMKLTDEREELIREVCENVESREFGDDLIALIKEQGYIHHIQYRFAMHYRADEMAAHNKELIEEFRKAGLFFFE